MVLALAASGASASSVGSHGYSDSNPSSVSVPEQATVSGGTSDTNIECAWALPDANPAGGAETSNSVTTATNYTGPNGTVTPPSTSGANRFTYGTNDDDPVTTPTNSSGTATTPCALGAPKTAPNPGAPVQANGDQHMIQVLPNAGDQPAQRRVELWAAVDDTQGASNISSVWWDVYHPDGNLKVELFGVQETNCFGPYGTSTTSDPMFQEAVNTGQLAASAVSDPNNGMIALCNEGTKELWHNAFTVSKDQPNGIYKVVAHAVDKSGNSTSLTYSIDVLPFYDLALDFNTVNYGLISATSESIVNGDVNWNPPADTRPSVTNLGNSGEQIGVSWGPMIGQYYGKCINNFDAAFSTYGPDGLSPALSSTLLQHLAGTATCPTTSAPGAPSATQWFNGSGSQLLCPNDIGKLDLSIDPQKDTQVPPADTYKGSLTISARGSTPTSGSCPTDSGSSYVPNSGTRTGSY